jgi:hypothetical protein
MNTCKGFVIFDAEIERAEATQIRRHGLARL